MRRLPLLVAFAASIAIVRSAPPMEARQDPQQQTPPQIFRAGTDTVVVPATVTDLGGRFVRDLTREDFVIRDNGRVQEISLFDREYQTMSAVVLLDASGSMIPALDRVISASNDFLLRLLPGDQARVGSFAEEIRISPEFTGDRDALLGVFENEFNVRIGRRTRLWDAMVEAAEQLRTADGRRALIVVTDGVDSWSTRTFDDVQSAVRRYDIAVFVVRVNHDDWRQSQIIEFSRGPDGTGPGRRSREPDDAIERLTRDTGGGFVDVDARWAHQAPFTDIMLDLHSAYLLGFTPQTLDGRVHDLSVEVRRPNLKVKARQTYVAEPRGDGSGGQP